MEDSSSYLCSACYSLNYSYSMKPMLPFVPADKCATSVRIAANRAFENIGNGPWATSSPSMYDRWTPRWTWQPLSALRATVASRAGAPAAGTPRRSFHLTTPKCSLSRTSSERTGGSSLLRWLRRNTYSKLRQGSMIVLVLELAHLFVRHHCATSVAVAAAVERYTQQCSGGTLPFRCECI